MSHSSRRKPLAAGALALLLVAALVFAGCGGGSSAGSEAQFEGDGYPGVDKASTRFVKGQINRGSAGELQEAWSLPLTAQSSFGAYAATPVIAGGVIYSQDLESNVQAIALEDGEVLWERKFNEANLGPNGVVVAEGMVFGATADQAFALDQETGKELWSTELLRKRTEGIDMVPGHREGIVYVSTVPTNPTAQYPAGGVGVLWALDAKTGKKRWDFETVPKGLWGRPDVNSGGGLWYPPSFDEQGFMYFGVGNPAPFPGTPEHPFGSSRPGPNLYTNSMVKMNAASGKMQWHYQQTPHDIYDWDFQNSPILLEAGGRRLAIGSGKSGVVVAIDRETGKPVWERLVGTHNGHDDDGLLAMRGEYSKLKAGSQVYPGTLGGVIAPIASDGKSVFVPVVEHPITVARSGGEIQGAPELTGEMVSLEVATGKVNWAKKYEAAAFGAPTVVNDLVFFATFDGVVRGLDATSGGEVWQASLPAASNSGLMASGDTLVVPAGLPSAEGQQAAIVAYRVGG